MTVREADGEPVAAEPVADPDRDRAPARENPPAPRWRLRPEFAAPRGRTDVAWVSALAVLAVGVALWWVRLVGGDADRRPISPATVAEQAEGLSDAVVEAWQPRLGRDARIPDPVLGRRGDYGSVMLLGAMLRRAVADGGQREIEVALRGLAVQAEDPSLGAFELLAFGEVHRWAAKHLPGDPRASILWRRHGPAIQSLLATRASLSGNPRVRSCFADPACFGNQKVVGAAALAELLRTGIAPAGRQSLLFGRAERFRDLDRVLRLVAERSGDDVVRVGARPVPAGGILSDPPRNPSAYHALSVAMLGRLITDLQEQGLRIPGEVRAGFQRAAAALLALVSPDGDLSYIGRGQGQVWVPAVTADAAAQVLLHVEDPVLRGAALTLAATALRRLTQRHARPDGMLSLLPDAPEGPPVPAGRATDHYAALRTYSGLAVWALDDAAAVLRRVRVAPSPLPTAADGVTVAPRSGGSLTVTRGARWLAVATVAGRADDARYGPGVLALRERAAQGWRSLVPERPFATEAIPTVAVEQGGATYLPSGSARAAGPGSALVEGTWRLPRAGGAALDPVLMRWTLGGTGAVTARWRAPRDQAVVARALVRKRSRVQQIPGGIREMPASDGRAVSWRLSIDGAPAAVGRSGRPVGGSAYEADLLVVALRATAPAGSVVELAITPR